MIHPDGFLAFDLTQVNPDFNRLGRHICVAVEMMNDAEVPYAVFDPAARIYGSKVQRYAFDTIVSDEDAQKILTDNPGLSQGDSYRESIDNLSYTVYPIASLDLLPRRLITNVSVGESEDITSQLIQNSQGFLFGQKPAVFLSPDDLSLLLLARGQGLKEGSYDLFDAQTLIDNNYLDSEKLKERMDEIGIENSKISSLLDKLEQEKDKSSGDRNTAGF